MDASTFCDLLISTGKSRYSLFKAGPLEGLKAQLQKEFEKRGYESKWHIEYSDLSWWRPAGYVSRQECYDEIFMWRKSYQTLAQLPDREIYIDASHERLVLASKFLTETLTQISELAEDDFSERLSITRTKCEEILDNGSDD